MKKSSYKVMKKFSHKVVSWPVVDGEEVTTNGIIEMALGLWSRNNSLIYGWCMEGFYTDSPKRLVGHLDTIEWARVKFIKEHFDIKVKSSDGFKMFLESPLRPITELRFNRLIKACFKSVSEDEFRIEVDAANRRAGPSSYVFGGI